MRIVVALGGNALERSDQKGTHEVHTMNVRIACREIIQLIRMGHKVAITHGNGPQVGNLAIQQESSRDIVPMQPLHVLDAMTQGQIGYIIQRELRNTAFEYGMDIEPVTIITQVLVNKNDPAFNEPSKPVGPFYDEETARILSIETGAIMKKVKPSGINSYRRVVASPDPIAIVEANTIARLVELGFVVIACGGGGIPVIKNDEGQLMGIDAVIDKDLAAERLAEAIQAEVLLILTDVERVKLNFGKADERDIEQMRVDEAIRYMKEGHFLDGSMKPKVLACIRFIEAGGKFAVISSLDRAVDAITGTAGTKIIK